MNLDKTGEKEIFELGKVLSKLNKEKFENSKKILNEIINYWEIEIKNLERKGKILNSRKLDELNLNIGKSVGLQFLYLLCPDLDEKSINSLASLYGFAIKLADNLSDLDEDLEQKFINISKEDIQKYNLNLNNPQDKNLPDYEKKEFERIKKSYFEADKIAEKISKENPSQKTGILLFNGIANSWFKQVSEFCFIENLRQFDISKHKTPKFLSKNEIIDMEKFYGVSLAKIIQLSYEQESRNTLKNKEKDILYNPYFLEGILLANEKIKKIISKYPEIKQVIDLGCDDGERTLKLYSGKEIYGIEFIKESAKQSEKKGIKMHLGSMISETYKNKTFDLVSLLGEMINFFGLDINPLLEKSIKQVKEKGYFLVTCTHSSFDKNQNGKYAIWSFKKSTLNKWMINEEKIPRAFCVISEQDLLNRIKNISQKQNCNLILKQKEEIENYYDDMKLGIYIFQKQQKGGFT